MILINLDLVKFMDVNIYIIKIENYLKQKFLINFCLMLCTYNHKNFKCLNKAEKGEERCRKHEINNICTFIMTGGIKCTISCKNRYCSYHIQCFKCIRCKKTKNNTNIYCEKCNKSIKAERGKKEDFDRLIQQQKYYITIPIPQLTKEDKTFARRLPLLALWKRNSYK